MKIALSIIGLLALGAVSGTALANEGLVLGNATGDSGEFSPARGGLVDEWNADAPYFSIGTYVGGCFAYPYTAPFDYVLGRVEFLAGGVAGNVTVEVRADSPTGAVLGSVSYAESATTDWQGEDLVPAVSLTGGTTYYLVYNVVPGANASTSDSGVIIPYFYAGDCTNYAGPFESIYWKARFYGGDPTPVEQSTWGRVKNTYR